MRHLLRNTALKMLDFIIPPRCVGCMERVDINGTLCADCWRLIDFIEPPYCICCGVPFEMVYDMPADGICFSCLKNKPSYAHARAVFNYDISSRRLILGFKYGDRLEGAPHWAKMMSYYGKDILKGTTDELSGALVEYQAAQLIMPVPLHPFRLLQRRFNQAALLALELGKIEDIPVMVSGLKRVRKTKIQQGLSFHARRKNVRGAFAVNEKHAAEIEGKYIVLIDDVYTTGATVEECCRTLKNAGAAGVSVLTLAKVL